LNTPNAYEIINYINDVSLNNAEVLMTSDREGKYNIAYTYGLERISVDNLNVEDSFKEEPLFYLYDGRGNTTELTDNRGVARDRYRYDPYGVPIPKATIGPNPWYTENPYRYNGEDYDINTGLQYLRARYYEPSTGRFLSRDSYLGNVMEPLTLNRYAYVSNNPIMYDDPTGHILEGFISAVSNAWENFKETGKEIINSVTTFVSEVSANLNNIVHDAVDKVGNIILGNSSNGNSNYNTSGEKYINDSKRDSKSSNNKNSNIYKPKNFIEDRFNQIQIDAKKDCTGLEKVSKQDAKVYASGVTQGTSNDDVISYRQYGKVSSFILGADSTGIITTVANGMLYLKGEPPITDEEIQMNKKYNSDFTSNYYLGQTLSLISVIASNSGGGSSMQPAMVTSNGSVMAQGNLISVPDTLVFAKNDNKGKGEAEKKSQILMEKKEARHTKAKYKRLLTT
jgi:RHS repeat-associated protein